MNLWLSAILLAAVGASGQLPEDPALSGMSRQMRLAIRLFERGQDLQAMDRFMEILTRGDPAERSMANEYLNLISQRMSGQGGVPDRPTSLRPAETRVEPLATAAAAPAARPAAPEVIVEPAARRIRPSESVDLPPPVETAPRPRPVRPSGPSGPALREPPPGGDRNLMRREIRAKLRAELDAALAELKRQPEIRILMLDNGEPQAIGIPTPLLFQSGIAFQKDARVILDALARAAFSVGSAQIAILPEGTAVGDAKVLDMRRTMGISSHLYSAGVAPPRVRVNLLSSQVQLPRPLRDFKGIVVLFNYGQPLVLSTESSVGEEAGPPISLGVFPPALRVDRNEGVVIEFSVQEPPAGLISWRFQLLQPSASEGRDLAPLQEVVGGAPVFHQIYWNGRQNYFGAPLPAGRYEAVLTAVDGKNRQRSLHRWIQLSAAPEPPPAPARAAAEPAREPAARPVQAPAADLDGEKPRAAALIKEGASGVEIRANKRAPRKAPAKARPAAPAAKPEPEDEAEPAAAPAARSSRPPAGNFRLPFAPNTHNLTPDGERRLAQISETLVYFPMEQLTITGHAQSGEPDPARLAERRAQMVAGLLINKYQIDPKRIRVASSIAEAAGPSVQVDLSKGP